jgi:hypothetical protein
MQKGMLKPGEHLLLIDNDRMGNDGKPIEIDTIQSPGYQFVSYGEEPRSFALILQKEAPKDSSSGSGFFGCGTIRSHRNETHGGGASALGMLVIFTPLVLRLLRLKIFRVMMHGTVR